MPLARHGARRNDTGGRRSWQKRVTRAAQSPVTTASCFAWACRAQSAGETRLRHAFHLMSLRVTPQARITDGVRTAFVDFLLDDYPVVAEFDGLVKYGGQGLRPGQLELVAEKDREDWLRGLGYQVVRVVWADLNQLATLAQRFDAAIRRTRGGRFGSSRLKGPRLLTARLHTPESRYPPTAVGG